MERTSVENRLAPDVIGRISQLEGAVGSVARGAENNSKRNYDTFPVELFDLPM
jgi:hypothetical protein